MDKTTQPHPAAVRAAEKIAKVHDIYGHDPAPFSEGLSSEIIDAEIRDVIRSVWAEAAAECITRVGPGRFYGFLCTRAKGAEYHPILERLAGALRGLLHAIDTDGDFVDGTSAYDKARDILERAGIE